MATALDLQKEINRFANDENIGFTPIACDGKIGAQTLSAALLALTSVNLASSDGFAAQSAGMMIAGINSAADLTAQLTSVVETLARGAFSMGLGYIACPAAAVAAAPRTLVQPKTPQGQAALDKLNKDKRLGAGLLGLGLPDWAVYSGGAAFALLIAAMVFKRKKSGGVAGRYW